MKNLKTLYSAFRGAPRAMTSIGHSGRLVSGPSSHRSLGSHSESYSDSESSPESFSSPDDDTSTESLSASLLGHSPPNTRFGPIPKRTDVKQTRKGPISSFGNGLPSAAFGQTLKFITSVKLQELEKQRTAYEAHTTVLEEANKFDHDPLKKVEVLLKAVRSWSGSGSVKKSITIGGKLDLSNLDKWIIQAKKDPNFSSDIIKGWSVTLEAHIRYSLTKFDFAKLFGNLFTEWLASGDSVTAAGASPSTDASNVNPDLDSDQEFIQLGRKEMHEQMTRLKSIIFEPTSTNSDELYSYLDSLFSDDASKKILKDFRTGIQAFAKYLRSSVITADDMRWTIETLLSTDLMLPEKRATLREFTENPTVLEELANVLNMRLGSLESWSWPAEGIEIEMRRHLNGKYRAFTDPDILDALFLHYLGVLWQIKFKQDFKDIFSSEAWKPTFKPLSRSENDRRRFFLKEKPGLAGIEEVRQKLRVGKFLAGQLASDTNGIPAYGGYDESADVAQTAGAPVAIQQQLLHAIITDCHLNTAIHKKHTVVKTDLEWFGPSLPHQSILTVLRFFGVPKEWLDFFHVFLRTPLRFKDDPSGKVYIRECGTPISYALSVVCGEAILFGMDLAVNQRANGLFLYRIHDDLWLWDAQPQRCVDAWKEMNRYASLVGMKFNSSKTGSACVGGAIDPALPPGDIRWGFLKFDPTLSRFAIDQGQVDEHIVELRRQLGSTKSVLGWINAHNKYMRFLVRNFGGRPAACLGSQHVDEVVDTLARIQREIFPAMEGGAIEHLRSAIGARFNVRDLPHGYFYIPIANGGLELFNPMIEFVALHDRMKLKPHSEFVREMEQDRVEYNSLKESWETGPSSEDVYPDPTVEFLPFEEYIAHRETRLNRWTKTYNNLLKVAMPYQVNTPPLPYTSLDLRQCPKNDYDEWIFSTYSEDIQKKFGSLEVVNPTLIPIGLVQLYKTSRMKWEQ